MIRTDLNPADFLKSILHVGDFLRQFKYEDSHQYWAIGIYGLGYNANIFYIDLAIKKGNLL